MSSKQLESGTELRNKILSGVNKLADYVSATLGPKGQNVLIQKKDTRPFVTKDGVTVASFIELEDPFENAGAQIVKQVSAKTNSEAGDGTTTATVIAWAIINNSSRLIASGVSPIDLKRGLDKCLEVALGMVSDASRPISSVEDVEHVARISANNDIGIGKLVATAVDKVGKSGSITIEEARSVDTTLDLVEGFRIDSGYAATAFITDERKRVARYDDPIFLITDSKLEIVDQILPSLEIAARENRPLIIVAEEIEGQALAALIMNTIRGSMKVAAIKAPRYGEERRNIMSDLAISVGAKFFRRSSGDDLKDVSLTDFGTAKSIEIGRAATTIVDGDGSIDDINERINILKAEIEQIENLYEAERTQERITRLSSGVAVIRVGAATEVEMIEKKHRVEDALEAVRSAQADGIVPGGGCCLYKIAGAIEVDFDNEAHRPAEEIFIKSLRSPFRIMAENSGFSPDLCGQRLSAAKSSTTGIDFNNNETVDMFEAGIVDPAKVTKCALRNAVSAASTLLLTNHGIVEV
jgi:chaperonin GroEL